MPCQGIVGAAPNRNPNPKRMRQALRVYRFCRAETRGAVSPRFKVVSWIAIYQMQAADYMGTFRSRAAIVNRKSKYLDHGVSHVIFKLAVTAMFFHG